MRLSLGPLSLRLSMLLLACAASSLRVARVAAATPVTADELLAATPRPDRYGTPADTAVLAPVDPLDRSREIRLSNRYLAMRDESFRNVLAAEMRQPTGADGLMRILVPFVTTDQLNLDTTTSSGDLRLGYDHLLDRTERSGLLLGADLILDTSSEAQGGRGTHCLSPRIVWAMYRGGRTVIAPSYRHTLGLSGEAWRPEINEGTLGLQVGWVSANGRYWVSVLPEVCLNLEAEIQFFSGSVEVGCVTGPNSRLHLRPSFGTSSEAYGEIGADYPYDWAIELGWRIGFP